LGEAAVLDDAVDLQRQACLQKFLVRVGQPPIGKNVAAAFGAGGFLVVFLLVFILFLPRFVILRCGCQRCSTQMLISIAN
jgi:hypothetical protein